MKNVDPAVLKNSELLGIGVVEQLEKETPDYLYSRIQAKTGIKDNPDVWDNLCGHYSRIIFTKQKSVKNYRASIGLQLKVIH